MTKQESAYKRAGVDVDAGYKEVRLIKPMVDSTKIEGVVGSIGGFGGLFQPGKYFEGMEEPTLIVGTDGVGTKIRIAQLMNKVDTVGIDAVAMCVNDIICSGAKPLFATDYIACGKNDPERIAQIVSGVASGCRQAGCALIGGETAEHPGVMRPDDFDLSCTVVGVVDAPKIIDGSRVKPGDKIIGFASNGIHSNGFSLVRKIYSSGNNEVMLKESLYSVIRDGVSLSSWLLRPTYIYTEILDCARHNFDVKAVAHISGGGFYENLPRMIPGRGDLSLRIQTECVPKAHWDWFNTIRRTGQISWHDMWSTFNMGVGMAIIVDERDDVKRLNQYWSGAVEIGSVVKFNGEPVWITPERPTNL